MESIINKQLTDLAAQRNIAILLAIESGSRAWGFPSQDSDYDVRFIYAHPIDWYLSVFEQPDVITLPINDDLDLVGWDLRKAIRLMRTPNIAILEWLASHVVYQSHSAIGLLRTLGQQSFVPKTGFHHYRAMANKHLSSLELGTPHRLKTLCYVLRTMFNSLWSITERTLPPIAFATLLDRHLPSGLLRHEIDALLETKQAATEQTTATVSKDLEALLQTTMDRLTQHVEVADSDTIPNAAYDQTYRAILHALESTT